MKKKQRNRSALAKKKPNQQNGVMKKKQRNRSALAKKKPNQQNGVMKKKQRNRSALAKKKQTQVKQQNGMIIYVIPQVISRLCTQKIEKYVADEIGNIKATVCLL